MDTRVASPTKPSDHLAFMSEIALWGGTLACDGLRRVRIEEMVSKGPRDYQTRFDVEVEAQIADALADRFPGYGIVGEEQAANVSAPDGAPRFLIDPIDGTTNYAWGIPHFGIVISLERAGEIVAGVVYDPCQDELFSAEKGSGAYLNDKRLVIADSPAPRECLIGAGLPVPGQVKSVTEAVYHGALRRAMDTTSGVRRLGSAALSIAYVAAGRFDGFFEDGLGLLDYGASMLIVREAGGIVTGFDGEPVSSSGAILAASPQLHPWLVEGFAGD